MVLQNLHPDLQDLVEAKEVGWSRKGVQFRSFVAPMPTMEMFLRDLRRLTIFLVCLEELFDDCPEVSYQSVLASFDDVSHFMLSWGPHFNKAAKFEVLGIVKVFVMEGATSALDQEHALLVCAEKYAYLGPL